MATFAPRIDDSGVPNSTGVSQGTGPNRTFENLFSGLTNTAKNVVGVIDTKNQLDIQDQAQKMFDTTNQEFGLAAPDTGPVGLSSELDRVQALQTAVDQGKISQVNYYGRLATLSKQLRTKYPGYEHIVDQTIQQVTGTRPANAYRDAIFQELGNLSEQASSDVKFRRQFDKENADVLSTLYGDDYFANPSKYDFAKVQADVGRLKGKAFQIDSQKKELDLMSSQGNFNDKLASRTMDQEFSFIVQSTMNKAVGANGPTPQQTLDQFVAQGGGSGTQLQDFINNMSMAESTMRSTLLAKAQKDYVSKGLMSNEDANKSIEAALFPITEAKKAVLGGDFKLASKYATISKAVEDQHMNEMLKDPTVLAGQGLSTLSKSLGDTFFGANTSQVETVAQEAAGRIIGGTPDTMKSVVESGNQKAARSTIDYTFKALVDPKLVGPQLSNTINQTFGPNAPDFMSPKVVAPSDLESLYLKFLNPSVTNAIKTKGSPQDLQVYTQWALEKAQAIPSFRAAAGDINSVPNQVSGNVEFHFDPQNMRLSATTSGKPGDFETPAKTARALDAFNKVMGVMTPIFEANGGNDKDRLAMAKQFVHSLNINLEGGQKGTFWDSVMEAIPDDLTKPISDVLPQAGFEIKPQSENGDGVVDFVTKAAKGVGKAVISGAAAIDEAAGNNLPGWQKSDWLKYMNSGATRNQPISKKLQGALGSVLPELGVEMHVFSGGQEASGPHRTGTHRHDHGNAADVFFYKDGRRLDWQNPSDIPIFQEIVRKAKAAGVTGFGAGDGYMRPGSMHIGFGHPAVWGANGRGSNAPEWLRTAFAG